jgi:hypothetical protein
MTTTIDDYLLLAASAVELLAHPAVAGSWEGPSALPEFTVGGLATHLAFQVTRVPEVLRAPAPEGSDAPVSIDEHYARSRWVSSGRDSEVNRGIRATADGKAVAGAAAIAQETAAALAQLELILPGEAPDRPVFLPWTGWSLSVADYLRTRGLEILVHSDDLAVSTGITTPDVPEGAARTVIDTLLTMSLREHGVTPVLRSLSRRERAPRTIAAI